MIEKVQVPTIVTVGFLVSQGKNLHSTILLPILTATDFNNFDSLMNVFTTGPIRDYMSCTSFLYKACANCIVRVHVPTLLVVQQNDVGR